MGSLLVKKDGFTLVEVLAVLALLVVVTTIAIPLVRNSIAHTHVEFLRSKMITTVLDLQNYINEREATNSFVSPITIHSYQSPFTIDNEILMDNIMRLFSEFPKYLAIELRCEEDETGEYLLISVAYPGYDEETGSQIYYRNLTLEQVASGYWPALKKTQEWSDLTGCNWEASNGKEISLPYGKTLVKTSVNLNARIYELNPNNKHSPYTLAQLANYLR